MILNEDVVECHVVITIMILRYVVYSSLNFDKTLLMQCI